MANRERINRTLDNIQPRSFNMSVFASRRDRDSKTPPEMCNTVMCFAGWAVHTAGYPFNWTTFGAQTCQTPAGTQHIEDAAAEWLDLNNRELNAIFYATGIETVEELRDHINTVVED